MAGSPCPIEVMRQVIDDMNMSEVTIAYGQTETSPVSTQTRTTDSVEARVTTVGQVLPHVEAKIVDPETGVTVERGQEGEYCTRGFHVMNGYWNDPEKTAEAIDADGWMHSGDLAVMDDDGYVNIVGRIKDMIIRGGENIYPREIEEFLYTHPAIADAQVIGVPDVKYGEEIMAWVQLAEGQQATEDDIKDFCKGKIAHFKIPRYISFVNDFPMTVTGKVRKAEMREKSIADLDYKAQSPRRRSETPGRVHKRSAKGDEGGESADAGDCVARGEPVGVEQVIEQVRNAPRQACGRRREHGWTGERGCRKDQNCHVGEVERSDVAHQMFVVGPVDRNPGPAETGEVIKERARRKQGPEADLGGNESEVAERDPQQGSSVHALKVEVVLVVQNDQYVAVFSDQSVLAATVGRWSICCSRCPTRWGASRTRTRTAGGDSLGSAGRRAGVTVNPLARRRFGTRSIDRRCGI